MTSDAPLDQTLIGERPWPAQGADFPFVLTELIGEGGYGEVFRAVDPALDRTVAIKMMRPQLLSGREAETLRKRFLQEARAAAALTHPGIATVFSVGETGGRPYLVMELLEGEDLESYSARRGPLPGAEVADIGHQLVSALGAAHEAGVIHRDIKPSNLMLLADGAVKVTDFGIARLAGRELVQTQSGTLIATPQYASPEQLAGETVDARTDLYSAGVVCYHLLSRGLPFRASSLAELFRKVMKEEPLPLREQGLAELPEWDALLQTALAKDRDQRFPDAAAMAAALARIEPGAGLLRSAATPAAVRAARPRDAGDEPTLALPTPLEVDLEPRFVHRVPDARTPRELIGSLIAQWDARDLGEGLGRALIPRLLDAPLHADAFCGALETSAGTLLIAGGHIRAGLGMQAAGLQEVLRGRDSFVLRTPPSPEDDLVAPLAAFVSGSGREEPEQKALQPAFVDLPRLVVALRAEDVVRVVEMQSADRCGLLVIRKERHDLLLGGDWPGVAGSANWKDFFAAADATVTIWKLESEPDPSFLPVALANTRVRVAGSSSPADRALLPEQEQQTALLERGLSAPAGRGLEWLLRALPDTIAREGREKGWKYLAQWIPEVASASLYWQPEGAPRAFDVATFDSEGKVLHLVHHLPRIDRQAVEEVTSSVAELKARFERRGDIGAVILVGRDIEESGVAAYRALLHQGRSNAWFGMDQSLGYHGFVRLSPRRGYHLLLARERGSASHAEPLWELGQRRG